MSTLRHTSAKKAWANLQERAELGEKFGFLACLSLFYKNGLIGRDKVKALIIANYITAEDCRKYREHTAS